MAEREPIPHMREAAKTAIDEILYLAASRYGSGDPLVKGALAEVAALKAENARLASYKDRLRGECVGALTEAGIYMLVSPEDPTGPGEVSRAIQRLAAERDSFCTSYDNLDHRHSEMTERAAKAEAERDAALLAIVSCPACMKRTGAALEALGEK